jgi:hypothetical protein
LLESDAKTGLEAGGSKRMFPHNQSHAERGVQEAGNVIHSAKPIYSNPS